MPFNKTFPKQVSGSNYPVWEEITHTEEEEQQAEDECRKQNVRVLDQCIEEAKGLAIKHGMNTEENRVKLAIALFEKRASHEVFWKENKAKDKFDRMFKH
jgi:hypothetical protein